MLVTYMDNISFISTAEHWGKAIDARSLSLRGDFYFLSEDTVLEMAESVLGWLSKTLSHGFVVKCYMQEKSIAKNRAILNFKSELQTKHYIFYKEEAFAISPVVYNINTFRSYMQNVRCGKYDAPEVPLYVSTDYGDFWDSLFPNELIEPDAVKGKILQIFREEGRKLIAGYCMPDVHVILNILPYRNHPNIYHGCFSIGFSAFSLGPHLDHMAEEFTILAEHIAQTYVNLNIQVSLQPIGVHRSPHMALFGNNCNADESHLDANCTEQEWYSTYYLPGVEWFNVISPLAVQHLQHIDSFTDSPFVTVKKTAGVLFVKSRKSISQFDISDALKIKELLQPALYPGRSYITFRTLFKDEIARADKMVFPRSNWAVVPVFENEIEVVSNYLVFSS